MAKLTTNDCWRKVTYTGRFAAFNTFLAGSSEAMGGASNMSVRHADM